MRACGQTWGEQRQLSVNGTFQGVKQWLRFPHKVVDWPLLSVSKAGPDDNNISYHLLSTYSVPDVLALCSLFHNNSQFRCF